MLRLRRKPLEAQDNGHDAPATSTTALLVDEAPDEDPCIPEESFRDVGRSLPRRLFHWGPIIAIVLIVQIGFTATFFTLQWWPILSLDGVLHMVVFLFWNYSTLINLSRAAFIGGGFVPKGWRPANPEHEKFLQWCHVCESFKVPRSHHCSKCGRCVMKMDHHCPWINNCVGHRNHAFFVRFLGSAVVGCLHAVFIIGFSLYHAEWYIRYGTGLEPNVTLTWYSLFAAILAFTLGAGVAIAVGLLLFYQIKYIIANKTGVEEYIVMKAERRREEEELEPFVYPYSLGWRRNVVEVLGTWSGSPRGNGVWWPLLHGHSQFEFSEEQLAQKRNKRAHSRGVRITRPFGGGCCGALRERGLRSFFCQPWNEDSRVAVSPGEIWLVTRGAKYWVYGIRVRPVEDASDSAFDPVLIEGRPFVPVEPAEKGWMPRDSFQLIPRDSDSSEE